MKSLFISTLILSLISLSACEKDEPSQTPSSTSCLSVSSNNGPDKSLQSHWVLLGYSDNSDHCVPSSIPEIDITFSNPNSFEGFASCNSMNGSYEVSGTNNLKITNVFITERGCADNTTSEWESTFISSLSTASQYSINGKLLTIESSNGKSLVFVCN